MTVERGPLFLVAGGAMPATAHGPDPLVRLAIQSTGVHLPRIAYVGVASRDDSLIRKRHAAMLRKAGAGVITTAPLAGYRINAPVAAAAVESADLVFLSGGDVEAGMDVLEERGIIPVLRRAHRAGVPFLGISAGSIMLSRAWVRWRDPDDDGGGETFPCLGFARIFCDTHGEDDGWGELKAMLSLRPVGTKGFGIVSGSALMVARTAPWVPSGAACTSSSDSRPAWYRWRAWSPAPARDPAKWIARQRRDKMEYRRLGSAGLKVSVLSFGSWVTYGKQIDVDSAAACMKAAWEEGVNFFDNAEAYEAGKSEEVMGAALRKLGWRRASYVVSTKIFFGMHDGVNERLTLNRKKLREGIDGALKRFGLDYLDLVFCHRPDPRPRSKRLSGPCT